MPVLFTLTSDKSVLDVRSAIFNSADIYVFGKYADKQHFRWSGSLFEMKAVRNRSKRWEPCVSASVASCGNGTQILLIRVHQRPPL